MSPRASYPVICRQSPSRIGMVMLDGGRTRPPRFAAQHANQPWRGLNPAVVFSRSSDSDNAGVLQYTNSARPCRAGTASPHPHDNCRMYLAAAGRSTSAPGSNSRQMIRISGRCLPGSASCYKILCQNPAPRNPNPSPPNRAAPRGWRRSFPGLCPGPHRWP